MSLNRLGLHGPVSMIDEDIPGKLASTILNAMLLADRKGWQSLAFSAISTGIFGVSKDICTRAFGKAVPEFWEQNPASSVTMVWLCLTVDDFAIFKTNLDKEDGSLMG